ncbi:NAD(P)H-hydrate epimerase [Dysgonomonas alginatilytica]|uniref:Bifunctional NAD(P)H-hydrate repair enzyme n=1 Tax=Dysgonomonas alginatilytica TaxID=1605892 RepID=A0A2V3PVJ3_9BACT|nr:NAD(P)H-hydrate dehydratase [Dysgonomonas alginatilytica]PXV68841.1 NAD(P)H-hydrate epimerase [Dysgonomonas alginatilytica]
MVKIFNVSQIKKIDGCTVINQGITSIDLMERASLAVAEKLIRFLDPDQCILVFAGTGNNGGDALAIARILLSRHFKLYVYIVAPDELFSDDCLVNKECLERLTDVKLIKENQDIPHIPEDCIVIDGLFGSGLNRPLEGVYLDVVTVINASHNKVYSVDMPSGMFVEDNASNNPEGIIKAEKVFTFQFPKLSLLLPDSANYCKKMTVVNIGLCEKCIKEEETDLFFIEKSDATQLPIPRDNFSHKGTFGKALLIAGSYGKMGAAVLSARACLRTGVGLLTMHVPRCGVDILQTAVPEAMVQADEFPENVSSVGDNIDQFAIGIGPGIGTDDKTKDLLSDLFDKYRKPMVIDADALNIIAGDESLKEKIPSKSIITPHPVEFDRLMGGVSINGYERLQKAGEFANRYDIYIVLKGAYSAIITPERKVYFNSTGNPGMATGGSGDVLTGMITSLLAQKYLPLNAAILGVYLHGLAGDLAAKSKSQQGMLPSDMIEYIGKAYRALK